MRRPTVRMIRHPPSAVPAVSAIAHATVAQVGAESVSVSTGGEQQGRDHAYRLLGVVRPVAEGEGRRHHPLAAVDGSVPAPGPPPGQPPQPSDDQQATERPQHRRDRKRDQGAEDPDGVKTVHASPVDGAQAALDEPGPHQPADERVARARRQSQPPGDEVPGGRGRQPARDHLRGDRGAYAQESPDRVGHRGADQQGTEHVEDRGEDDRLPGRAARVATSVAIAFAASCSPLVTAKPIASRTATASSVSIPRLYGAARAPTLSSIAP